jgi:hypothetical protein
MDIEQQLLRGLSYRKIAVTYSEVEYESKGRTLVLPKIEASALRNHYMKGHLPVDAAIQRQLIEERAKEVGSRYEEMAGEFLDSYVAAKAILRKGYDRIVKDEIAPDVKETLAAAKMVQEIEDGSKKNLDAEAWSQAMTVYFQTAQEIMSDEMWRQFTSRLSTNPILRALTKKMAGEPDEEILDAEVVTSE